MPIIKPTQSQVHVNRPLTNIVRAYTQDANNFVASKVFPVIPVNSQTNNYWSYPKGAFLRNNMAERAAGTMSRSGNFTVDSTGTYSCVVRALNYVLPDPVAANADDELNLELGILYYLGGQALINSEVNWATANFATGIWSSEKAGSATTNSSTLFLQWNDANSTPIEDIQAARTAVLSVTGVQPNVLTVQQNVYDKLVNHPDIIDRLKYGQTAGSPAMANRQSLAALFEVDEILVTAAIQNTANDGATDALSFICGKHALLTYRPPVIAPMVPVAGATFSWRGYLNRGMGSNLESTSTVIDTVIRQWYDAPITSNYYEIQSAYDFKVIGADLGFMFLNAVA